MPSGETDATQLAASADDLPADTTPEGDPAQHVDIPLTFMRAAEMTKREAKEAGKIPERKAAKKLLRTIERQARDSNGDSAEAGSGVPLEDRAGILTTPAEGPLRRSRRLALKAEEQARGRSAAATTISAGSLTEVDAEGMIKAALEGRASSDERQTERTTKSSRRKARRAIQKARKQIANRLAESVTEEAQVAASAGEFESDEEEAEAHMEAGADAHAKAEAEAQAEAERNGGAKKHLTKSERLARDKQQRVLRKARAVEQVITEQTEEGRPAEAQALVESERETRRTEGKASPAEHHKVDEVAIKAKRPSRVAPERPLCDIVTSEKAQASWEAMIAKLDRREEARAPAKVPTGPDAWAKRESKAERKANRNTRSEAASIGPPLQVLFHRLPTSTSNRANLAAHDLRIAAQNNIVFLVHRQVLIASSDHFKTLLLGLPDLDCQEPAQLGINDELPVTVLLLLRFCYSGRYDGPTKYDPRICTKKTPPGSFPIDPWVIHTQVAVAAEKYGMPSLSHAAIEAFKEAVASKLKSARTGDRAWATDRYRAIARRLAAVTVSKKTRRTGLPVKLEKFLVGVWKMDGCKLARSYLPEDEFYKVLLAVPDGLSELVELDPAQKRRYEELRVKMKLGSVTARTELFRPLGLHTPEDVVLLAADVDMASEDASEEDEAEWW